MIAVGMLLAAAVLFVLGGLGEVGLLTARQCGATNYLCEPPTPANFPALYEPAERYGSRYVAGNPAK